jgi:hypothetical protein
LQLVLERLFTHKSRRYSIMHIDKMFSQNRPLKRSYERTIHKLRVLDLLIDGHNYKNSRGATRGSLPTIYFPLRGRSQRNPTFITTLKLWRQALQDRLIK